MITTSRKRSKSRPRASIVIRCFNEEQHIGRLLHGITRQTEQDVETVVVDSGSTDDTVKVASQFPIKLVKIRPEEFSFGRALNIGCDAASGEFLIFASAHVYPVYDNWLERMLAPFSDPQVGLVYGKQRGNEFTKYSEHQVFACWFGEQSMIPQHHWFCNNANAAIRKSLWEKLPYDELLTGLEDVAWAKLIMNLGHQLAYEAEAEIIHVHDEKWKQVLNRYRREAVALKRIFPEEEFNFRDFARLLTSNVFSDCYHAWKDRQFFPSIGSIFAFRLMQFWGTYRGFRLAEISSPGTKQSFYYPRALARTERDKCEGNGARIINYPSSAYNLQAARNAA